MPIATHADTITMVRLDAVQAMVKDGPTGLRFCLQQPGGAVTWLNCGWTTTALRDTFFNDVNTKIAAIK